MLPAWFATQIDEAARVCPPVLADECPPSDPVVCAPPVMVTPAPLAPIHPPPSTAGDAQAEPEPDVKVAEEGQSVAPQNKRPPAPRPRFDLRAALAKCKPHPTTLSHRGGAGWHGARGRSLGVQLGPPGGSPRRAAAVAE